MTNPPSSLRARDPRPGDLRVWRVRLDTPDSMGRLFLVTHIAVAPGEQWSSSKTPNAVYYIEDGVENWHYFDAVKWSSEVIEPDQRDHSETTS